MPRKIFVKVQWEFPTAGHLVFWKPCPWVKIPKKMLCASTKNSCPKILKPSFENRLGFMPTNIKCLGKVWTILLWITWELVNHFTLSVSELEYFWSVKTMKISLYARLDCCPYFKTKAVFEIAWVFETTFWCFYINSMRYFVKIVREFLTAGHLVFWKPYPWVKIIKNMLNASAENLSTMTRNLYLESLGISEQTLNTLVRFRW